MAIRQPIFSKSMSFVAVRQTRLSADTILMPGDAVEGLRLFHLRDLYRRRRIGPVGHPWTEDMLANQEARYSPERMSGIPRQDLDLEDIEPFMNQDEEGRWVLGKDQVFDTLEEALAAWHNTVGTEDPSVDPDKPEDAPVGLVVTNPDETGAAEQPKADETAPAKEPEADKTQEVMPAKEPVPVKSGSQWTIKGVDGKFSSAKKAKEAWDAKNDPLEN